jgi:hypothetical protein
MTVFVGYPFLKPLRVFYSRSTRRTREISKTFCHFATTKRFLRHKGQKRCFGLDKNTLALYEGGAGSV